MDLDGARKGVVILTNQKGQSVVEYILLMALIATILVVVFEGQTFQNFVGENGSFVQAYKGEIEYNYRHALPGKELLGTGSNSVNYNRADHPSYLGNGATRFFGPLQPYP